MEPHSLSGIQATEHTGSHPPDTTAPGHLSWKGALIVTPMMIDKFPSDLDRVTHFLALEDFSVTCPLGMNCWFRTPDVLLSFCTTQLMERGLYFPLWHPQTQARTQQRASQDELLFSQAQNPSQPCCFQCGGLKHKEGEGVRD